MEIIINKESTKVNVMNECNVTMNCTWFVIVLIVKNFININSFIIFGICLNLQLVVREKLDRVDRWPVP